LSAGDVIVIEGVDKLRAGSAVQERAPGGETSGAKPSA